jgi:hypothetical protein
MRCGGRRCRWFAGARAKAKYDSGCSQKDKYFHSLDSFVESSAQMPQPDVFLAKFFRRLRHRHLPAQFAGSVNPVDHLH